MTPPRFAVRRGALQLLALILLAAAYALLAGDACAQPLPESTAATPPAAIASPPDTAAIAPTAAIVPPAAKQIAPPRSGEETDRFELGVGAMGGFFDVGGSFAYRRYLGERWPFERTVMCELTGTKRSHITEGTVSTYWLFRPLRSYSMSRKIRPLIEAGPGAHLVFQAADIEGFARSAYEAHVYIKTHAYAGVEVLATRRWGFLVRGRVSIPSHQPLDYAQAAIFLR